MTGPSVPRRIALALCVLALPAAWARNDCDAPAASWQPRSAVQALAERKRWQIERLKIDDGCYEIKGRTAEGLRFKARVDPASLDVLSLRQEPGGRAREHDRQRRALPPAAPPAASGASAPR